MLLAVLCFLAYFVTVQRQVARLSSNVLVSAREHGSDDVAAFIEHFLRDDLHRLAAGLPVDPGAMPLHRKIRTALGNTAVVKLTLYDPGDGTVRYSSDPAEIGTRNPEILHVSDPSLRSGRSRLLENRMVVNFDGITLRSGVIVTATPIYRHDPRSGISTGEVVLIAEIFTDSGALVLRESTLRSNFVLTLGLLTAVMLSISFAGIWMLQIRATSNKIRSMQADGDDA